MGRVKTQRVMNKIPTEVFIKPVRTGRWTTVCDQWLPIINLHILVADVWIPNPDNCDNVRHIDGNTRNNSLSNLERYKIKYKGGRPRKTPDPFQHLRDEPVRLPKIIDNRYSLLPIPGTTQWSVYFIGGVRAVHLGMYESQKEAEDSVR